MKKRIAALMAFLMISLTACSSDRVLDAPPPEESSGAEQTAPASEPNGGAPTVDNTSSETSLNENTSNESAENKAPTEQASGIPESAEASSEEPAPEPPVPDRSETSAPETTETTATTATTATTSTTSTTPATTPAKTESTSPEVIPEPVYKEETGNGENGETRESETEISDNNMETSIHLFDKISAERENSMFSPLSLNMALGLLDAGAGGSSKAVLDSYLGTDSYADFAQGYMKRVRDVYNSKQHVYDDEYYTNCFEIANSFWADNDLPLKPEYIDSVSGKFDAEIRNLDFGNKKETLNAINGWVNDKTHKLIPSVLNDYNNSTVAVLVNTVYFESGWINEWSFYEGSKQTFTLPDGSTKEMPLMSNYGDSFFENESATAFSSTYKNGMEFIGILPKAEGDFALEELDIPSLLASRSYDYDVLVRMPRLDYETNIPLTELLQEVGLREIFDRDAADFSGISEQQLYVSSVIQKTKLELDEYGTKAAAVTAVLADCAEAMPEPKERREVFLDRPFAFLIYDRTQNQIVFIGKVTNP